jgi:hypothetical protein
VGCGPLLLDIVTGSAALTPAVLLRDGLLVADYRTVVVLFIVGYFGLFRPFVYVVERFG